MVWVLISKNSIDELKGLIIQTGGFIPISQFEARHFWGRMQSYHYRTDTNRRDAQI